MAQTRLKQLREEAVLTVHELAEASGVSDDTISKIENGQRVARPNTLRKLARALDVSPQELRRPAKTEELANAGKAEAPREAGPALLEKLMGAVLQDEERRQKTINRGHASEGQFQHMTDFAEDKVRAELLAGGFPDEYFENLVWPLAVRAARLKQENARLKEENARLREEAEQESVHR